MIKVGFLSLFAGLMSLQVYAQQGIRINGSVTDNSGELLSGVNITIKGAPSQGVMTDDKGEYSLTVPSDTIVLVFSSVGYETQEVTVGGRRIITVILREEAQQLDDVTIVAFGTQKKESVLASITTVKPSELKVPSSNLTTAFAGRVAGLISYQQSGEPGQDNASFFIRGITSFGADAKKDPLILIDGVELSTEDLARLNTDNIASFSIMKDASAAALYGARGANGVILVTTKEGVEGRVTVNVRLENSFSRPTKMIETADPVTFMRMHNESLLTRNPYGGQLYSSEKTQLTASGRYPDIYPATNWYDAMLEDRSINQRANLSVSGGGPIVRYYVAANVTQDNGNMKVDNRNNFNSNISLTKYDVRSNINVKLTKTTELVMRLSSAFDEYIGPLLGGADMYTKVMQANPVLFKPYYEPDEHFAYVEHILFGNSATSGSSNAYYVNPYAEAMKGYKDYSKNTTLTQFEIKQDLDMITEGLKARVMINMNRYSEFTVSRQYKPFYYNLASYNLLENSYTLRALNPESGEEFISYEPGERKVNMTFYMEGVVDYGRVFNEKHSLNGTLVYIMRQYKEGASKNLQLSLPNRNLGLSGRLSYNYDSRYFTEFNFGYNGSERFSTKHRWGFFPSIGAAWMLSNEKFFEPLKDVIPQLKVKGTYGLVGNDAIGSNDDRFYYLAQVTMGALRPVAWGPETNYGYNPGGIHVDRYANDKIGWETAYKTNLGVEFELKNGFSAYIDFFHEKRTNILLDRIISETMGIVPDVKSNLGVASGQGVDMELNYEKIINNDLWITGRGTFTYATSKVLEWEEPDYSATPWLSRTGYSVSQKWGYIAERLFIDDQEVANSPSQWGEIMGGDIKYRDINGDGRISELDKVPIGFPDVPEINYGFGFSVGYKNWDISAFFQGSARQSFWMKLDGNGRIQPFLDSSYSGSGNDGLIGQNAVLKPIADSYWSENNRDPYAFWPRLSYSPMENNSQQSTWFMHDASFLRLKSAEIGYTLPEKMVQKLFMTNLRVYVSATNLASWSGFKLWDPEMAGNGLGYPLQRVVNIGLNVSF
jgi:TonB-linked SusC/RagA family outer membrane protein